MSIESIIGWDIGGAQLKVAHRKANGSFENVLQIACPLWKGLNVLERAIHDALKQLPTNAAHAVTMTGELVDIFSGRAQGVEQILGALGKSVGGSGNVVVYGGERCFMSCAEAVVEYKTVASANWYASEQVVADRVTEGLFLDIGSTTTDMAIIRDGKVEARGRNDAERMRYDELVYLGSVRTPLMAICERIPFHGQWVSLAAEHFAVTADVFRLTGDLPENADLHDTADGADKSLASSAKRIARMIGQDFQPHEFDVWRRVAQYFCNQLMRRIETACELQISRGIISDKAPIIGAGVGRFITREIAAHIGRAYLDFSELLSGDYRKSSLADCAPAVSVATLYAEQLNPAASKTIRN